MYMNFDKQIDTTFLQNLINYPAHCYAVRQSFYFGPFGSELLYFLVLQVSIFCLKIITYHGMSRNRMIDSYIIIFDSSAYLRIAVVMEFIL